MGWVGWGGGCYHADNIFYVRMVYGMTICLTGKNLSLNIKKQITLKKRFKKKGAAAGGREVERRGTFDGYDNPPLYL